MFLSLADLSHNPILYYCYNLCSFIISILDTGSQQNKNSSTLIRNNIQYYDPKLSRTITKRDKCGEIIEGGRIKLIQHKKEFHSIPIEPSQLLSKTVNRRRLNPSWQKSRFMGSQLSLGPYLRDGWTSPTLIRPQKILYKISYKDYNLVRPLV